MKLDKANHAKEERSFLCLFLTSLTAFFIIFSILGCQIQNEQVPQEENLRSYLVTAFPDQQETKNSDVSLFEAKCSGCHNPDRALTVIKDQEAWEETIRRMQYYSKGNISDSQVRELVGFHVNRQQAEIDTFQETCTQCHDDERINNRSMSAEQWQETIRRMQRKAPELISDEKVVILSSYFHRRELTMARIFYDKCPLCHGSNPEKTSTQVFDQQINNLIVLSSQELGESFLFSDFKSIQASHVERQKRNMQLYENNCQFCHASGLPKEGNLRIKPQDKRTRSEWILFIASLQKIELTKELQKAINSQIEFHISRH